MNTYNYFRNKKVLLYCDGALTRGSIKRAFVAKGAKPENVAIARSMADAFALMSQEIYHVIVADYQYHHHFGLELAEIQRTYQIDSSDRMFFVVANSGEARAVADAADEEIDAFVIRPFLEADLIERIERVIEFKVKPNEKARIILQVKTLMNEGKLQEAKRFLLTSINYVDDPAILYYFLGKLAEKENYWNDAFAMYLKGLEYNPFHYKCLCGYMIALYKIGKKALALEVLEKISAHYPLSPEILKYGMCAAIETYRFDQIEKFYQVFIGLVRKPDDLKVIVSASLLAAGKMVLRNRPEMIEQVHDFFTKGAVISGREETYLTSIILELIRAKRTEKINRYFEMIEAEGDRRSITMPLRLRQYMCENRESNLIISLGKETMDRGFASREDCLDLLSYAKANCNENRVYEVAERACALYPDCRDEFASFL